MDDDSKPSDRVLMQFPVDDDPTVGSEGIWVAPTATPDEYVIDNVPFHARDISRGDTVRGLRDADHTLRFEGLVRRGARVTYQFLLRPGVDRARLGPIIDQLGMLDAAYEGVDDRLVTIDVDRSREADLLVVLEAGWTVGTIWYEKRSGSVGS